MPRDGASSLRGHSARAPSLVLTAGDLQLALLAHEQDQQDQVQDFVHVAHDGRGVDLAPFLSIDTTEAAA